MLEQKDYSFESDCIEMIQINSSARPFKLSLIFPLGAGTIPGCVFSRASLL
jgi:hypothetical protein